MEPGGFVYSREALYQIYIPRCRTHVSQSKISFFSTCWFLFIGFHTWQAKEFFLWSLQIKAHENGSPVFSLLPHLQHLSQAQHITLPIMADWRETKSEETRYVTFGPNPWNILSRGSPKRNLIPAEVSITIQVEPYLQNKIQPLIPPFSRLSVHSDIMGDPFSPSPPEPNRPFRIKSSRGAFCQQAWTDGHKF